MTGRRWGLLFLFLALLGYALGQEWLQISFEIAENHTLDFFVGMSAALSGVVALDRRPGNAIGWLLVGTAAGWYAPPYDLLEIPTVSVISWLLSSFPIAFVAHLVLAYPSGRLQTRPERGLIISFYAAALVRPLAEMAVYDPRAWGCAGCEWQPAIWPSKPAYETIQQAGGYLTILQVLAFAGAVVLRFMRSSRVERHDLQPLWVGALILGVIEIIGAVEDPSQNDFVAFLWQIRAVLLILVPPVFLYGLLTDRTAKLAIGDLILRLEHDIPAGQLGPILAESLGDPQMRIVYAAAEGDSWVAADGSPVADPAEQEDRNHAVTVIRRDHRPYAALIHDSALSPTLVTGVAATAAFAIENEWLHAELKAQLEQVRASRARIVAAGHEERRKVERDLHDGAQQRLLTLALALHAARRQVGTGDGPHALSALDQAEQELKLAIEELRELARGIHPTILTDEGLPAALRSLAVRATLPVAVSVELPQRLAPAIEATVYFAVSEALANISKHSGATRATIDAHILDNHLSVLVTDDGCGGADTIRGSGLRDRVAAAEGTLEVVSPVGNGTAIEIALPVPVQATT